MSAFAALVASDAREAEAHVARMLRASIAPYDTASIDERAIDANVAIGARTTGWEHREIGASVARGHGVCVVADATLHHRDELQRALRVHVELADDASDAMLLCAAVRAFGERVAEFVEGDVAFVAWDARRSIVIAARDRMGRRPLYHATASGGLAFASHPAMLLAHPEISSEPNVLHLAGRAAGLLEAMDTAYAAIEVLHPGHTLVARIETDGRVRSRAVSRHWLPPTFETSDGVAFDEAATRLRAALKRAAATRLARGGATAVWLSGGYDSPSVFAAAAAAAPARRDADRVVRAVSMRYPVGDPGHEDARILAVAERYDTHVTWHDVDTVDLFADDAAVARRAGPFAHAFERWMQALAARAVGDGARVVFDGSGGDQLFQVSPVYLADLVRRGRWLEVRRELRALGMSTTDWRRLARTAVLPVLPAAAWGAMARLRGGVPVRGLRAGVVPTWIRGPWRERLVDRLEIPLQRRRGESAAALESRWYLETSYAGAVFAEQTAVVRAAGAEVRSPLYDDRVMMIAAGRPRVERAHRGETKCLLRAAMRARLPAVVLAPRSGPSGTTNAYFRRRMTRELPGIVSRVLHDPALADLGVLEPALLAAAISRYLSANDGEAGAAIFATVQAERWLRARG